MKKRIGLKIIVILMLGIPAFAGICYGQIQPYQLSGTAGYVDTTAYDTVSVPYVKGSTVAGFITNEDETNDLVVYFAKRDSVSRDPNSYVKIGPGKRLKFSFAGRKIFRKASADSVYSQVVFGDGMDLGSGGSQKSETYGTDTTSSGICTLNTVMGRVITDNAAGSSYSSVTINNSIITSTGMLQLTVLCMDVTDAFCSITDITDGAFTVVARRSSGGTFDSEIQFIFHITKP